MADTAFEFIDFPMRPSKPRSDGLTMMIDWGLPLALQSDVVAGANRYIDMAKIAGTIAGVMPRELLEEKIAAYRSAGISTSQGGLFTEMAYMQGKIEPFFERIAELGFDAVEISDNLLNWSLTDKEKTIRLAIEEFGLKVLGEVGRKDAAMDDDGLLEDLRITVDAGVTSVFVEAYELFAGDSIREDLIAKIAERHPSDTIIYELPVVVLPGVTREFKHKVALWMVDAFGSNVNLANVEWDEIWMTEIIRRRGADNLGEPDNTQA